MQLAATILRIPFLQNKCQFRCVQMFPSTGMSRPMSRIGALRVS